MAGARTPSDERRPADGDAQRPQDGRDDKLPYGRRRRTAASALVAMIIAMALGALLNAPAMKKTAQELPFGTARTVRLALIDPLASVSHWFYLDRPAKVTAAVLGKPDPGPARGPVVVVVTPPKPLKGGKPPADRPLPKPFKGHPMHLYIAGDSMMGLPGMALVNLSNKTKLIKPLLDYRISTGLVRPDAFNWPAQLQSQVKAFDPGAVAAMFGANDNQPLQSASGDVYQFGSDRWKTEYRKRVQGVVGLLFQDGVRRIYWVGQPIMPSASFNDQIKLMNEIYASVAKDNFGVQYIDAYKLFSDSSGRYSQYLPDAGGEMQQVREQDGEHLTYAGGLRVAQAVMDAIKKEWFPEKGETSPPPSPKPGKSASPKP
ncbi:MAG: SGNH/GDSL hydrolase family protein [Thermoleophilia bacterium]